MSKSIYDIMGIANISEEDAVNLVVTTIATPEAVYQAISFGVPAHPASIGWYFSMTSWERAHFNSLLSYEHQQEIFAKKIEEADDGIQKS